MITWEDFQKIDMRVGTILEVLDFPKARNPSYKLKIDFGKSGILYSSAQIVDLYTKNDLLGMQVIAVVNFHPKKIADFFSECLVLGVYNQKNEVVLLQPAIPVHNGNKIG